MSDVTNFVDALDKFDLNWEVAERPVFTQNEAGEPLQMHDCKAIVRLDNDSPLKVVGKGYYPVQNNSGADIFDSVLAKTGGKYVNGGSFKGGRKVFVQAELPDTVSVRGNDHINKLLTYVSSHDMSTQVLMGFGAYRIWCENSFTMAVKNLRSEVTIRHTASAEAKLQTVEEILKSQLVYFKELEIKANWLADKQFTDLQMGLALRKVLNIGPNQTDVPKQSVDVMDRIMGNFVSGRGITADNRGTAWAAYNAFTEYTNHQKRVNNSEARGGAGRVRLEGLMFGSGGLMNSRALSTIESLVG